jgi:DNA-binding NarL/FixJ family response regulator
MAPEPVPDEEARLDALATAFALSERERGVARLILEGLGNKQIAARLSISTKTVNNHVYNLFQKLGINSRFELISRLAARPSSPSHSD